MKGTLSADFSRFVRWRHVQWPKWPTQVHKLALMGPNFIQKSLVPLFISWVLYRARYRRYHREPPLEHQWIKPEFLVGGSIVYLVVPRIGRFIANHMHVWIFWRMHIHIYTYMYYLYNTYTYMYYLYVIRYIECKYKLISAYLLLYLALWYSMWEVHTFHIFFSPSTNPFIPSQRNTSCPSMTLHSSQRMLVINFRASFVFDEDRPGHPA